MIFTFGELWIVRLMSEVFGMEVTHVGGIEPPRIQHKRMQSIWMSISKACNENTTKEENQLVNIEMGSTLTSRKNQQTHETQ